MGAEASTLLSLSTRARVERVERVERAPYIVGLGGTLRANSSTEKAVRRALDAAAGLGAEVVQFTGEELDLPTFTGAPEALTPAAKRLLSELRRADGVIIGSPGYHGAVSGLMKNALDYLEDMNRDVAPYLHGRAVGCIATAAGWQAAITTLANLRGIVHALRGWPTPLGVAINTAEPVFDADGVPSDPGVDGQFSMLAAQVVEFAQMRALRP